MNQVADEQNQRNNRNPIMIKVRRFTFDKSAEQRRIVNCDYEIKVANNPCSDVQDSKSRLFYYSNLRVKCRLLDF